MYSYGILGPAANLLIRRMTFVGNVKKSPIASHLKGFDSSFEFRFQSPALTEIKEGR